MNIFKYNIKLHKIHARALLLWSLLYQISTVTNIYGRVLIGKKKKNQGIRIFLKSSNRNTLNWQNNQFNFKNILIPWF